MCWLGMDRFVWPKTTSALGSVDRFMLTKVLIKTTSTCWKSSSLTWCDCPEAPRTVSGPYSEDRKAGEVSVLFFKRSWDPAALTGLLEVIQVVSFGCRDHAMTRTVPTVPCCLGIIITLNPCCSRRSSSLEEEFDVPLSQTQCLLAMNSSLFPLHNSIPSFFPVFLYWFPSFFSLLPSQHQGFRLVTYKMVSLLWIWPTAPSSTPLPCCLD